MTTQSLDPRSPDRPADPGVTPAILVGENDDHRRLIRGLMMMHHQPIALEAPSLGEVPAAAVTENARMLVFVAPTEGDAWSEELRTTLAAHPGLNTLVLLPLDAPATRSSAARAGARAVLSRPFTSRDFLDALDRLVPTANAAEGPPRPAAPRRAPRA